MGRHPSPDERRRDAAAAWFAEAQAELATARSLSAHRDEGTAPFAAAFHAQQAVEKGAKALLLSRAITYPRTHDLSLLVGLLPTESATKGLAIAGLTVYAVDQRYVGEASNPMDLVDRPTWDEADEAIATADHALSMMRTDLLDAGWAG